MSQIQGSTPANIAEVDPTFKSVRVTIRPSEVLAWNSVSGRSGALTGVAAGAAVFSLRNLSSNLIIVRRVGVGFITTTAFTTAQEMSYALFVERAFTVSDSGQTAIAVTGSNTKHRTSLGTPTSLDCRISSTAALTAGTKTADANALSVVGGWAGGVGQGITPSINNLFTHDTGDYPLVLHQNEGLNIVNAVAMGAAGVGSFYANLEFAEVATY